jgi:hypothetical protein
MRYRLRTLLILMAIVGLPLARIGYLKRIADFHRREVARIGRSISVAEREDEGHVAASIKELAEGDTELVVGTMEDSVWMGRVGVYDKDMTGRLVKDAATAEKTEFDNVQRFAFSEESAAVFIKILLPKSVIWVGDFFIAYIYSAVFYELARLAIRTCKSHFCACSQNSISDFGFHCRKIVAHPALLERGLCGLGRLIGSGPAMNECGGLGCEHFLGLVDLIALERAQALDLIE